MTTKHNTLPLYNSPSNGTITDENKEQPKSAPIKNSDAPNIQQVPYITSSASSSGVPEFLTAQKVQESSNVEEYKSIIDELESRVQDDQFEPESTSTIYERILQEQRSNRREAYVSLLKDTTYSTPTTIKSILRFLANVDYSNTIQDERNYIVRQLNLSDTTIQRYAINTLLCWGNFSNITTLKGINLNNCYLQELLNEFISKQK